MFKLSNVEGNIDLTVAITDYQFPESLSDNWCFVKLAVKQGQDTFEVLDPTLETTELLIIREWFACLNERTLPRFACLCFTEPCLQFDFLASSESSVRISINLNHELKPSFDLKQFGRTSSKWNLVFELGVNELNQIISGLDEVLQRLPIRGQ